MAKPTGPKQLVFDLEVVGLRADSLWSTFDQNISLAEIKEDWAIISYAAKWLGGKRVYYSDNRHGNIRDDKRLVQELCSLIDSADVVIGQNVRRYDMKKVRARQVFHDLPPFREPRVVDTLEMAKGIGAFTSNRLEYLSKLTGVEKLSHAQFPGKQLWIELLAGNQKAWEECRVYNIRDVEATEALYRKLRPFAKGLPNLAQYYNDEEKRCPRCGSVNLEALGVVHSNVSSYNRYRCGDCTGFSRDRLTINSKEKRRVLLAT